MENDDLDAMSGKQIRELLEGTLHDNKTLAGDLVGYTIEQAGFAPDSTEGRALARLYDGEPDVEAIQDFAAKELGWQPPEPGEVPGAEGEANPSGWTPERQRAMHDGEARRTAMASGALPARDPSPNDEMRKAADEGDWEKHDRLAAQSISRQHPAWQR